MGSGNNQKAYGNFKEKGQYGRKIKKGSRGNFSKKGSTFGFQGLNFCSTNKGLLFIGSPYLFYVLLNLVEKFWVAWLYFGYDKPQFIYQKSGYHPLLIIRE